MTGMIDVVPYQNNNRKSDYFGYWYFRVKLLPTIVSDELANHIASDSKIERAKVLAINDAVTKQARELLCNGHAIHIPHLGTLKLGVSSSGTETSEEYKAGSCIKNVHLVLVLDQEIKETLKRVKYRKVLIEKKETPTPPEP